MARRYDECWSSTELGRAFGLTSAPATEHRLDTLVGVAARDFGYLPNAVQISHLPARAALV